MRGAFKGGWDPLNGSKAGDVLQLKGECLDWFLYCDCVGDVHMDTMPVSKEKLGVWTSRVLERMGRLPRPYSAHRRGMVTRALSVNIYKNKGLGISGALENALLRVGGWDATVGGQTLRARVWRISWIVRAYQMVLVWGMKCGETDGRKLRVRIFIYLVR